MTGLEKLLKGKKQADVSELSKKDAHKVLDYIRKHSKFKYDSDYFAPCEPKLTLFSELDKETSKAIRRELGSEVELEKCLFLEDDTEEGDKVTTASQKYYHSHWIRRDKPDLRWVKDMSFVEQDSFVTYKTIRVIHYGRFSIY